MLIYTIHRIKINKTAACSKQYYKNGCELLIKSKNKIFVEILFFSVVSVKQIFDLFS